MIGRILASVVAVAGSVTAVAAQDAPRSRSGLTHGWLTEILDADPGRAAAAYREVSEAARQTPRTRERAIGRLIELARLRGDLATVERLLPELSASRLDDDDRTRVREDPIAEVRAELHSDDPQARKRALSGLRRRVRGSRGDPRLLTHKLDAPVPREDAEFNRQQQERIAVALRAGDRTTAARLARELRRAARRPTAGPDRQLGLQVLHLRLRGETRAAARLLGGEPSATEIVTAAPFDAARLRTRIEELTEAAPARERKTLERLLEVTDGAAPGAVLDLLRDVPFYAAQLLGA